MDSETARARSFVVSQSSNPKVGMMPEVYES